MKKSLFAIAAVGAFVGVAQAQSSVTVYGLVDAGIAQTNIDYNGGTGQQNQTSIGGLQNANGTGTLSGSRLGFRGVEDLGGGNIAGFVIENALNYNNATAATGTATMTDSASGVNSNTLFGNVRQAYASISNAKLGELRIGTQNSLAKDTTEAIDPLAGATITGAGSLYQNSWNGFIGRYSQAATYNAPTMSGVSLRLQTTVDGTPSNNGNGTAANAVPTSNRSSSASLDFTQGNIKVNGYYERKTTWYLAAAAASGTAITPIGLSGTTAAVLPTLNSYSLGATYDFKVVKPAIMYYNQTANGATSTSSGKATGTLLGVTVPISAVTTIFASYTAGKIENNNAGLYDTAGMQLVANYNLSKRTGVYAAYGQTNWNTDNTATAQSVKYQQYGIGMRHTF